MDVRRELSARFLETALARSGFRLDPDQAFRLWSETSDICCVVDIQGKKSDYSGWVGFCSPRIAQWFGLPDRRDPGISRCNTCGISFRLGELLQIKQKVQRGWRVSNDAELEYFGLLFRDTLAAHLPALLAKYMDYSGWISHFRVIINSQPAGRAFAWSMLGYALLASSDCSLHEIREVVASHAQEDGSRKKQNRNEAHIERQRALVLERFGVVV